MLKFRVAPGLKVDLFAAEPMVQNIVSFAFDVQGRCYVVESRRRRTRQSKWPGVKSIW
jgi:quinoprotein glucose dehydrogenase